MKSNKILGVLIIIYFLLGFIWISKNYYLDFNRTMLEGIVDGFFIPAKVVASIFIREITLFETYFKTVPYKLGTMIGIASFFYGCFLVERKS